MLRYSRVIAIAIFLSLSGIVFCQDKESADTAAALTSSTSKIAISPVPSSAAVGYVQPLIKLHASPDPKDTTKAMFGRAADKMGRWTITACNDGEVTYTLSPHRVVLAFPSIRFLSSEASLSILESSFSSTKLPILLEVMEGISSGGTFLLASNVVKATNPYLIGFSVAMPFMHYLRDRVKGKLPDFREIAGNLSPAEIKLLPGDCTQVIRYAALQKGAAPLDAVISSK